MIPASERCLSTVAMKRNGYPWSRQNRGPPLPNLTWVSSYTVVYVAVVMVIVALGILARTCFAPGFLGMAVDSQLEEKVGRHAATIAVWGFGTNIVVSTRVLCVTGSQPSRRDVIGKAFRKRGFSRQTVVERSEQRNHAAGSVLGQTATTRCTHSARKARTIDVADTGFAGSHGCTSRSIPKWISVL